MTKFWILIVLVSLLWAVSYAKTPKADLERTIPCDGLRARQVRVARGRITILNFPTKPKDVVPGEVVFDFKQIKNDLVIKPLNASARTNIVVYLESRRCIFDLMTVSSSGDDLLIVKDPKDSQYEVKFNE